MNQFWKIFCQSKSFFDDSEHTQKKQIAYENGNIVFKTEAQRLAEIKVDLINLLQYRTVVYITTYYPD